MLHELCYRDSRDLCGAAERKALTSVERRGDRQPNARLTEQRVVAEVNQHGFGMVAIQYHDRIPPGVSQGCRRIVLELSNTDCSHDLVVPICRNITQEQRW